MSPRTFSRSLEASVAVEELAKAIYLQRCRFVGVAEDGWSVVPWHVRSGLEELALRVLRELTEPSSDGADPMFRLSNDLARADARRSNIIARISPTEPWGVEAS